MKNKQFLRTDNTTKRISCVTFHRQCDDAPDLSYLGEYQNDEGDEFCIDRQERGDMGRNEFRYFQPATTEAYTGKETWIPARIKNKQRYWRRAMLKNARMDYERAESYNAGNWFMTFCQCKAEISINGVTQIITSGGLGGVESDSDASYFDEIRDEQLSELRDTLESCGFTKRQIDSAFHGVSEAD